MSALVIGHIDGVVVSISPARAGVAVGVEVEVEVEVDVEAGAEVEVVESPICGLVAVATVVTAVGVEGGAFGFLSNCR